MYILRRRTLDWINTHLTVWEGNVELHGSLLYRINNYFFDTFWVAQGWQTDAVLISKVKEMLSADILIQQLLRCK